LVDLPVGSWSLALLSMIVERRAKEGRGGEETKKVFDV
jgi:hypothetical protein